MAMHTSAMLWPWVLMVSVASGEITNRISSARKLMGTEISSSGRALPARDLLRSMSRPTMMLPSTTKMTEMTGSHLKNSLAQLLMFSTSVMYLLK